MTTRAAIARGARRLLRRDQPEVHISRLTEAVLRSLLGATANGLRIGQMGVPPGLVHSNLAALEAAGWVTSNWEAPAPGMDVRYRIYRLTDHGQTAARQALGVGTTRPQETT